MKTKKREAKKVVKNKKVKKANTEEITKHSVSDEPITGAIREIYLQNQDFDTSSVVEVSGLITQDEGDLLNDVQLYEEVKGFIDEDAEDTSKTKEERIEQGLDILERFYAQQNISWNAITGSFTDYAIKTGIVLVYLKKLVKESNEKWNSWAEENIPFISQRTRQELMQLAGRPDCYPWMHLGKDRLIHLVSATKNSEGEDPIGNFLEEHNIVASEDDESLNPEESLKEFKNKIDTALMVARAKKIDVDVEFEKVKALVDIGYKITNNDLRELSNIKNAGGDPNEHLDRIYMNRGKAPDIFDPEKQIKSLNSQISKFKNIFDYIIKNEDSFDDIDHDELEALEEVLTEIRSKISSDTE